MAGVTEVAIGSDWVRGDVWQSPTTMLWEWRIYERDMVHSGMAEERADAEACMTRQMAQLVGQRLRQWQGVAARMGVAS